MNFNILNLLAMSSETTKKAKEEYEKLICPYCRKLKALCICGREPNQR